MMQWRTMSFAPVVGCKCEGTAFCQTGDISTCATMSGTNAAKSCKSLVRHLSDVTRYFVWYETLMAAMKVCATRCIDPRVQ